MCAPYLESLSGRMLSLHDSIRSARLEAVQALSERDKLVQELANSTGNNGQEKEVKAAMSNWDQKRREEIEPCVLTAQELLTQAFEVSDGALSAKEKSSKWNSETPESIKELYRSNLQNMEPLRKDILREACNLAADYHALGVPIQDSLDPGLRQRLRDLYRSTMIRSSDSEFIKRQLLSNEPCDDIANKLVEMDLIAADDGED